MSLDSLPLSDDPLPPILIESLSLCSPMSPDSLPLSDDSLPPFPVDSLPLISPMSPEGDPVNWNSDYDREVEDSEIGEVIQLLLGNPSNASLLTRDSQPLRSISPLSDDSRESWEEEEEELPTITEVEREAVQRLLQGQHVPEELRPCDADEDRVVADFMRSGCGCAKNNGGPCSDLFDVMHVKEVRLSFRALERNEFDMSIIAQLAAFSNTSWSVSTKTRHVAQGRQKAYSSFFHQGSPICRQMFLFLHSMSKKKLCNLTVHFKEHGIVPRIHGNTKRLPHNTTTVTSVKFVVRFLLNYSAENALLLPGRVPGYSRSDLQLLPSSTSKKVIWQIYLEASNKYTKVQAVAYCTFCKLWQIMLPQILLMKPMTDLCWTCQQNSAAILKASNCPELEKSAAVKEALKHLELVQCERSFYKTTCDQCKREVQEHFTEDGHINPPPPSSNTPPNSRAIKVHYSFDYAQQVHFPSDPLQPGPVYFLTPRKCTVFGVNCEALPRQINFLGDEAGDCGKGANTVVNMLDFFFDNHGLGEEEVFLHADSCTGQNKNNCMLWYLAWRAMTGRHTQITLSFLVVGHTKFSPDWCFGFFKRLYRRTKVGSLEAIAQVVNDSVKCNHAQLVTTLDGDTIVPVFDWTSMFAEHFKKLPGIKKLHHFRFTSSEPGVVYTKTSSDATEKRHALLKKSQLSWLPDPLEYPPAVSPKGLSAERQWYLYDSIREFCPAEDRDITCPEPSVPKPGSRAGTPISEDESIAESMARAPTPPPLPPKKKRWCGICRREGHNSRSCPDREH